MSATAAARASLAERLRTNRGLQSEALVRAVAAVPRERFLGAGPWFIRDASSPAGRWTPSDDAADVYVDGSVALDRDRDLYSGAPGVVCAWLEAVDVRRGDHILHIGAGTGYYTAILAELTGPDGRVVGVEIDEGLAARAQTGLAPWPWANVAATPPPGAFDVIVVHAGATHIAESWLDALRDRGRLCVPLTATLPDFPPTLGKGVTFLITRTADGWLARALGVVMIYSLIGGRDADANAALSDALRRGGWEQVTRLLREPHAPAVECWLHARSCLRTDAR